MKKRWLKILVYFFIFLFVTELALRLFLDNESRVLYLEDAHCEYRLAPSQSVTRFHNLYETNEYGMRSGSPSKLMRKKILLFGDSVLNGGTKIDQQELLNYILESKLSATWGGDFGAFNISAGSWGPENAFRFMENYVDFDFDLIVLVFSSHDYHDNMHFRKVVGVEPAWPNEQPFLALTDLFSGYISPKVKSWFGTSYDYLDGFDDSAVNPGWKLFFDYAREAQKPIIVYHHPDQDELESGIYNEDGKALEMLLTENNIRSIQGITNQVSENYIDNIHVNANGHAVIAQTIFERIMADNLLNLTELTR